MLCTSGCLYAAAVTVESRKSSQKEADGIPLRFITSRDHSPLPKHRIIITLSFTSTVVAPLPSGGAP